MFAGDIIYDGPPLYQGFGMDVDDYEASFKQLEALPVRIVHAGHDPSFGKDRLGAIIATYRARWRAEGILA
ncbi:hypothetical protein [Aureimonas sp. SA4125]|uniref:hypothetical protein n=1 Tax=Aureimonas sp. SA4125 TaxID=2826993 RepID=UPI00226B04EE|nr:hypothetical protein [Aureimonas sp. SA4125]